LSVHEVSTGTQVARFGIHDDEDGDLYTGVALTRDGGKLVSASLGGTRAHLWDIETGTALQPMPRGLVDLSPDGAEVVTHELRDLLAELSTGVELRIGPQYEDATVMLAPDRRSIAVIRLASNGRPGVRSSEEYNIPEGHPLFTDPEPCTAVAFSADSNHLLLARPDGTIVQTAPRLAEAVIARARQFVFRSATPAERGSFSLDP
jgi:WD40 repeat protein